MLTTVLAVSALHPMRQADRPVVVTADRLYVTPERVLSPGSILIRGGKIEAVGETVDVPSDAVKVRAAVATAGLIDARTTVGLSGILNSPGHDQDQLDQSEVMQPQLRALDAFNAQEALVKYVRGHGVTTVNTGHGPGALVSGQTFLVKTHGRSADQDLVRVTSAVVANLGGEAGSRPGTRAKQVSVLRAELTRVKGLKTIEKSDLKSLAWRNVLDRKTPLIVHADRAQDIASALRLQREFGFQLWLEGGAELPLVMDDVVTAKIPVLLHPTMQRTYGDTASLSFETAAKLHSASVRFAFTTGFEGYVPKIRVLLFEAQTAVANGLPEAAALRALTVEPASILGLSERIGTLERGKQGDVALFDGDPFEYTSHCVGTVIDGIVYDAGKQ
ncbi:MAG: amidohydrolase family protein [Fimbriimonadaceae bacterium]|nr:amidohydrolase family protein [Fimbriimonadaceae bacterium]